MGRRIVELLLGRGESVRFMARGKYPQVVALGAEGFQGDLRDPDAVRKAVDGVDVVYHVASLAGYWGHEETYRGINVDGTRNVLNAMRQCGVRRLIYTSTPSVVGYERDVINGQPGIPYPMRHKSPYPRTKAVAEQMVCDANGKDLATVSLRPHLIIGPGDNNLLPRVVERALAGTLVMVGDGTNKVDFTYVDNAAWAHLDAADALKDEKSPAAGRAYFISNNEPVLLWDWLNGLLGAVGCPPTRRRISYRTARALGGLMETAWTLLPLPGEPRVTQFLASALARSHWYDMGPAQRDFHYQVRVPLAEGTRHTAAWLRSHFKIESPVT
ncbi:Nucleoside-diphosphate-sugar epimerase [Stigmatella erecta]|uniref:Nucleoside-diphosphate-sugar epimerase n=1 Tax=Stigmatella erecta TaxID=83460 RepID=A0A1I0DXC3_9BACT|nr:Nucleoside-diphosphate-sugar epimerase [Stigmatella erecta]